MRRLFPLVALLVLVTAAAALAQELPGNVDLPPMDLPDFKITPKEGATMAPNLQIMCMMTLMGLIPYIVVTTTAYIRVTIMLSYTKNALGSTQALTNQIMMGVALIFTFFIMYPVGERANEIAVQPYMRGDIKQPEFFEKLVEPSREFMLAQTRDQDLALFCELGGYKKLKKVRDCPINVIYPAFIMSEVKTGFMIGFLIYLPFLLVDMIVAAVLMSMGMFMLSPMTISLPFKLLLFCTIDGWHILLLGVCRSFNRPPWMGLPP